MALMSRLRFLRECRAPKSMRTRFARVVIELCAIIDLQVPPENGMPDDTGYEECIVPTDMNLLTGKLFLIRT